MSIVKALKQSINGVLADQWKEIITVGRFDEYTVVKPGELKNRNNNHGVNINNSEGVITNGSKIIVPENTVAFIFSQSKIEHIIYDAGEYEYLDGMNSVINGEGVKLSIFTEIKKRFSFGGIPSDRKNIAFMNLREIRNLKFGTRGPQIYNDLFYNIDLEIHAYGSFTIQVVDPIMFIKNYLPANVSYYSFDDTNVKSQLVSELLQSLNVALNKISLVARISEIPSKSTEISEFVAGDTSNAGTWEKRFGFKIVKVSIENIELSEESKDIVKQYSTKNMNIKAYENISAKTSDIAAQQKIAEGIRDNGLGDGGGMIYGMNLAQNLNNQTDTKLAMSIDKQIESVIKLKDLLEAGVLTQDEFNLKKKEIMGL